jgi:pimeloyl-ACP methyl ester carboxylesterase
MATNAARFEIQRRAGVGEFATVGTVPSTQATYTDTGLVGNTIYTWRVRSDNQGFFSPWSNEVTLTLPAQVTTVFLVHGLFQGKDDMRPLATSLAGALDAARYRINAEFDYSRCTSPGVFGSCSGCSITQAAQNLANTILDSRAEGDIVLIGYSLGGLIARDLIANNWSNVFGTRRRVAALITLAGPNGGYPYASIDDLAGCQNLLRQMDGNWRTTNGYPAFNTGDTTRFLPGLIGTWPVARFPGANAIWLAAGGQHCDNAVRRLSGSSGCPDTSPRSDGVVCKVSALNEIPGLPRAELPNRTWDDPERVYAHTTGFSGDIFSAGILCGNSGARLPMGNPPSTGLLFRAMRDAIVQAPPAPGAAERFDVLGASDEEVRQFVEETVERGFPVERGEAIALLAAYRGAVTLPLLEGSATGRELIIYAGSAQAVRMLGGDEEAVARALDNAWQWGNALEVAAAVAGEEGVSGAVRAWVERERGTERFRRARERLTLPVGHPLRRWME